MGKKYLDTKGGTLESSILDVWKQAIAVTETNKNDKSDDGEGLDAVQPKAVKKKFKDRKDKDIDNDGDTDSSDKYLHKRRKAVSKAIATEARQLKDKKKEMMVKTKTSGVKVIDKSDWPVYKKKGYFAVEEAELDEGGMKRLATGGKDALKGFKKKPKDKKEEVEEEVADQYTEASYFTVQSMRERLHQVWGEAHTPDHDEEEDEKKIKGKKAKTDTGKPAAVIDVKPEIKERKK